MDIATLLSILGLVFKFFIMLMEKSKDTPQEKRAEHLAEVDAAVKKARSTKDLSDLSKLLGGGL